MEDRPSDTTHFSKLLVPLSVSVCTNAYLMEERDVDVERIQTVAHVGD